MKNSAKEYRSQYLTRKVKGRTQTSLRITELAEEFIQRAYEAEMPGTFHSEAMTKRTGGGHTVSRHVGKTPDELISRFNAEPKLKSSSSFRSMSEAESLISKVLRDNKHQIEMWVKNVPPGVPARMPLNRTFAHQTGITILKGSTDVKKCYGVRVILDFQPWHGKPYFVVTAYPVI